MLPATLVAGLVLLFIALLAGWLVLRATAQRRRRARSEHAMLRRRARAALTRAGSSAFTVNGEGRITWFEGPGIAGTGLDRASCLGQSAWALLRGWPDWVADIRAGSHGLRTERELTLEGTVLEVCCGPVRDDDAGVTETIVTVRDATEAFQQVERAERLADMRTRMLGTMNHRLRSQLNGIVGLTGLLAESDLRPEQREWVELMRSSEGELLTFVAHLVDFFDLEAQRLELHPEPFDLRTLLHHLVEARHEVCEADGTSLLLRYPLQAASQFQGDTLRIEQLVSALVDVALGTNRGGQVVVNVDEVERDIESAHLVVSVEDSGRGISPEARERIFDGLESASAMWSRRSGGSGLELAIAKRLGSLMGGSLEVESAQGVGTTFRLEFALPRVAAVPAPGSEAIDGADIPDELLRGRVLLVDDGVTQQSVARTILEQLGQEVVVVDGGAEAIEALDGAAFDIVLTEVHMPRVNGIELTAAIRSRKDAVALTPVVALTADSRADTRARCERAGMDGFLAKPLEREALRRVLHTQYSRREARDAHAAQEGGLTAALDPAALERLQNLDRAEGGETVRELVGAFLAAGPRQLLAIRDLSVSGGSEELSEVLRSFEASCRIIGAGRLGALADALGQAAEASDVEAVRRANAALSAEFGVVASQLERLQPSRAA